MIKPNIWNHITVSYDSATGFAIVYVNGTEKSRSKGHGLLSTDWNQRVGIGRHKGARFLDGVVDEFKLFGEALQKDAVEDLAKKCDFTKYCKYRELKQVWRRAKMLKCYTGGVRFCRIDIQNAMLYTQKDTPPH